MSGGTCIGILPKVHLTLLWKIYFHLILFLSRLPDIDKTLSTEAFPKPYFHLFCCFNELEILYKVPFSLEKYIYV